ncbi:SAF domain-containing protein, partial [Paraburkholderia sp. SIMBA_049]
MVVTLHGDDNVAVALRTLEAGTSIEVNGLSTIAVTSIPAGHKIATRRIVRG